MNDECIAAVRRALGPDAEDPHVNDATLRRFLVARHWDVAGATAQLRKTLAWRRDNVRHPLRCLQCEDDASTHCVVPLGYTSGRHPIVYGCPAKGRSVEGPPTVQHVINTLEHLFSLPDTAETWVWCVDFSGFGYRDVMNVQIGLGFASVLPHHYPERLHRIVMVNRPRVSVSGAFIRGKDTNRVTISAECCAPRRCIDVWNRRAPRRTARHPYFRVRPVSSSLLQVFDVLLGTYAWSAVACAGSALFS